MPSLDTNILIRYLVQDDPKQNREANAFIAQYANTNASLFHPSTVILETAWVLRSVYKFSKESIIDLFTSLLEAREISFQDEASVERAVYLFRDHHVDFADCFHVATAYTFNHLPLVTFDKKAVRAEEIEAIPDDIKSPPNV